MPVIVTPLPAPVGSRESKVGGFLKKLRDQFWPIRFGFGSFLSEVSIHIP